MGNKTYIYCGSNDMSIMKLCLSTVMLSQFEMVTLLLGHPVFHNAFQVNDFFKMAGISRSSFFH